MNLMTTISPEALSGDRVARPRAAAWGALVVSAINLLEWLAIAAVGFGLGLDHRPVLLVAISYAGIAEVIGLNDADARFSLHKAWGRQATAITLVLIFMVAVHILLRAGLTYHLARLLLWGVLGVPLVLTARAIGVASLRTMQARGTFTERVAIYGITAQGNRLARSFQRKSAHHVHVVGFYDERTSVRDAALLPLMAPIRGTLATLIDDIRAGTIDQVVLALPWSDGLYLRKVISQITLTPVRVRLAPETALMDYPTRPIVLLGDVPMMTLFERPISGFDQVLKRAEDIALSGVLLVIAAPLLLVTALAIKLDSPGPVLFRQPREGFNTRPFNILKFRSMHIHAAQTDTITQARRGDARITRVGRIIRRTSIDELPQLFNVLRGDMSLVGPRPHAPSTRAGGKMFGEVIGTYAARHKVKPGITGWAQVCGWRGETDTEDKLVQRVEHDLYYIENWSLWLDLYIVARTVFALVGTRAY